MSTTSFQVQEESSYELTIPWLNQADEPLLLVEVASLTLTLYELRSGVIINSRSDQDILNANGVTFHSTTGIMVWSIQPADTAAVTTTRRETHRALFELTLGTGAKKKLEVDLVVSNLQKVPT